MRSRDLMASQLPSVQVTETIVDFHLVEKCRTKFRAFVKSFGMHHAMPRTAAALCMHLSLTACWACMLLPSTAGSGVKAAAHGDANALDMHRRRRFVGSSNTGVPGMLMVLRPARSSDCMACVPCAQAPVSNSSLWRALARSKSIMAL